MAEVLILDDDRQFCAMVAEHVQKAGHGVSLAHSLAEGRQRLQRLCYDIVFLDMRLPDGSGQELLPEIKTGAFPPEVIIVTGYGDAEGAELAITHGAWDYLQKTASVQGLLLSLSRALLYRESRRGAIRPLLFNTPDLIGSSPAFRAALTVSAQAAASEINTLVTGETGTGKELIAVAIHENSRRSNASFVVVDCASLPDSLVGSVLFGHERGAFTGAERRHDGLIKQADGGTLFLDEVGELPLDTQKAFLRVLQEHRFRPTGSNEFQRSDFRLIAATNRNLEQMAAEGKFRHDLLFRLRGMTVNLPPLRDRMEDLPVLCHHFVIRQCEALECDMKGINESFFPTLRAYNWPGNVRELQQAIVNAVVKAGPDPVLYPHHLPDHVRASIIATELRNADGPEPVKTERTGNPMQTGAWLTGDLPLLRDARDQIEKAYMEQLIARADHDINEACRLSGVSRPHVYTLLKKHGLKL